MIRGLPLLLVFAAVACGVLVPRTPPFHAVPNSVAVSESVGDNLNFMYKNFTDEFILCIEGRRRGNGVLLEDFRMPHIARANPTKVWLKGSCKDAIADFHTHTDTPCYLSRTDTESFIERSGLPFAIVMCGQSRAAWWHISQVAIEEQAAPLDNQWVTWTTN